MLRALRDAYRDYILTRQTKREAFIRLACQAQDEWMITQAEIGEAVGLSRQRISQLLREAE